MKRIIIFASGRIRHSPLEPAYRSYIKEIRRWTLEIREYEPKILHSLQPETSSCWIALDERGQDLTSAQFATLLEDTLAADRLPTFFIGPAEGFPSGFTARCERTLSFGRCTWPHLLARVLLVEQIYRAEKRMTNHPYSSI